MILQSRAAGRTFRRGALATAAALALAGCGSDTSKTEGTTLALGVVKGVTAKLAPRKGAGGGGVPDPERLAALAKASFKGPLILAQIEKAGLLTALGETGRNGAVRTFATPNEQTLVFRDGLLTATRGLGNDLMSAKTAAVAALILNRRPGTAARTYRYLDGEGTERRREVGDAVRPAVFRPAVVRDDPRGAAREPGPEGPEPLVVEEGDAARESVAESRRPVRLDAFPFLFPAHMVVLSRPSPGPVESVPAEGTAPRDLDAPVGVPVDAVQGEKIAPERLVVETDHGPDLSGADFPDRGPDERVPLLDPDGAGEVRAEEPLAPPHLEPRSPAVLPEARRQERVQQLRLAQVALLERLERRERGPEDEVRRLVRRRRGSGGGRQEEARQEQAEGREDSQTSP